jgi:hypothetical protein
MLFMATIVLSFAAGQLWAQGCIIAHTVGQVGGPESHGGYLETGHWQISMDYRHQYSPLHFVGSVAQVSNPPGSAVRNRINLVDLGLTYQATPRWSVYFNAPAEFASRRSSPVAPKVHENVSLEGVGDISFTGQYWLWNPESNPSHNVQLGVGIQMPTGRDNIQNHEITTAGEPAVNEIADYSIQPGIGGWGIPLTLQSFQSLGHVTQLYLNGSYLITPQGTTNVLTSASAPFAAPLGPQLTYISISDEYLLQGGVAYSFMSLNGLAATFGLREEGVPAHDLIGSDAGFRRPGRAVSLEPGFLYSFHHGRDLLIGNIDRAIYRNRELSVPGIQLGGNDGHGNDAAFANWLWLASFTHRF